jgi:Zn-dependent peptidase ImmA (M78 family)
MLKDKIIEFKANQFREVHGMTVSEPVDLYKLLARLNVITLFRPISDSISGMAIKTGEQRYMMVNANDILARQHFTIAHELYHLFVQENFTNRICYVGKFDRKDQEEYNADWFASYLLMPEAGILEMIPPEELGTDKITLNTVVKLEQYFSVSRSAITNRLRFMDLLTPVKARSFKKSGEIIKSALMMGYSDELYNPGSCNHGKVIGNYGEKAKRLYDKEQISETDYYGLMLEIGVDLDQNYEEDVKAEG